MPLQVPRGAGSPPVPIMHSPPRPVSVKDQQDWKIPPSISNWKNPKGYTIPLDKRLAADGRGLQETAINDSFAKFTEALYMAESSARQASEFFAVISSLFGWQSSCLRYEWATAPLNENSIQVYVNYFSTACIHKSLWLFSALCV